MYKWYMGYVEYYVLLYNTYIQGNLCNKDTTETTVSYPVYGGVFILKDWTVHMSM